MIIINIIINIFLLTVDDFEIRKLLVMKLHHNSTGRNIQQKISVKLFLFFLEIDHQYNCSTC